MRARRTRTAFAGTSPSIGRPFATRSRTSVEDTSRRGISIAWTRQPAGASMRSSPARATTASETSAAEFVGAVPRVDLRRDVGTDNEHDVGRGGARAQVLDGVDRVRRADTVEFQRGRFEPGDFGDCRLHHFVPERGRCDDAAALLPRVGRDHQQHAVERELMAGFVRRDEVCDVHGIERPAEDAETFGCHGRGSLRTAARRGR